MITPLKTIPHIFLYTNMPIITLPCQFVYFILLHWVLWTVKNQCLFSFWWYAREMYWFFFFHHGWSGGWLWLQLTCHRPRENTSPLTFASGVDRHGARSGGHVCLRPWTCCHICLRDKTCSHVWPRESTNPVWHPEVDILPVSSPSKHFLLFWSCLESFLPFQSPSSFISAGSIQPSSSCIATMEAIPCFLVLTMEVIQNLVILTGPAQLLCSSPSTG